MKTALFVDFDNVYSGLRRLDPAYAEAFATDPLRWMTWLGADLALPDAGHDTDAGATRRRILVRRCYLNPVLYQRYRFGFSRAGFEIVDCPPMTVAGKTSTDIHMVLDIVDVLQSATRYDEFMVFSADADFTPVLRKLRRDDRRTTIFAAGATSASYDASADLIIDPELFVREGLGVSDEDTAGHDEPDNEQLLAQAEALTRTTVDRATEPVPLTRLNRVLATELPELVASRWAGRGHFTALLRDLKVEPLRIDREQNCILDPRRVRGARPATEAPSEPPLAPAEPTLVAPGAEQLRERLAELIRSEVAVSDAPVPLARLGQRARMLLPELGADWLGAGTFKRLLDTLSLPGLELSWSQPSGHLLDPSRHQPLPASDGAEHPAGEAARDPRWPQVGPMLQVAGLPALSSRQYAAVLQALSQALGEGPFALAGVSKRVRDLCLEQGVSVARTAVNALVRTLLFNGFDPVTAERSVEALVAATCGMAAAACEREGLRVGASERESLLDWMLGTPAAQ